MLEYSAETPPKTIPHHNTPHPTFPPQNGPGDPTHYNHPSHGLNHPEPRKVVLHLPMSTPKGLLYCSKRDGGLGIPKLETIVTSSALKQGITLLNSLDPSIHALLKESTLEQRLEGLAKHARLQWPILNFRVIDSHKMRMKTD
jgi:hypothetical protein